MIHRKYIKKLDFNGRKLTQFAGEILLDRFQESRAGAFVTCKLQKNTVLKVIESFLLHYTPIKMNRVRTQRGGGC